MSRRFDEKMLVLDAMNNETQLDFLALSGDALLSSLSISTDCLRIGEIDEDMERKIRDEKKREQAIIAARKHRRKKNEELSSFNKELESLEAKNKELERIPPKIESILNLMHEYLKKELPSEHYEKVLKATQMIRSCAYTELEHSFEEANRLLYKDCLFQQHHQQIDDLNANYNNSNISTLVYDSLNDNAASTSERNHGQTMTTSIGENIEATDGHELDDLAGILPDMTLPSYPYDLSELFQNDERERVLFNDIQESPIDNYIDELSAIWQLKESLKEETLMKK